MAENENQEVAPLDEKTEAMQRSIENLERKNSELIAELRSAKSKTPKLPEGESINDLLEYKQKAEQNKLEAKGDYDKARQALEQQFRQASKEKDERIKELEARVKDLELIAPALSALAPLVHDTDYAMTKLGRDNFEVMEDGSVAYVNGYLRLTIIDAVEKHLAASDNTKWVVKQATPQGGGAPSGRSSGGASAIPPGTKNPFTPEDFNLSEQSRLFLRDKDMYERLKAAASR